MAPKISKRGWSDAAISIALVAVTFAASLWDHEGPDNSAFLPATGQSRHLWMAQLIVWPWWASGRIP